MTALFGFSEPSGAGDCGRDVTVSDIQPWGRLQKAAVCGLCAVPFVCMESWCILQSRASRLEMRQHGKDQSGGSSVSLSCSLTHLFLLCSGLGYILGSSAKEAAGDWHWALRVRAVGRWLVSGGKWGSHVAMMRACYSAAAGGKSEPCDSGRGAT